MHASLSEAFIINSPYENESELINILIEFLTDNLYLCVISIYLLLMLSLIFICKLLLSTDINFVKLSKIKFLNYNLGEKIAKLLVLYISM